MIRKTLKAFSNVAASGTASLSSTECDGRSLHALHFILGGGNTKANMTRIQVTIGGVTVIDHITGTQLENFNNYCLNRTQDATHLTFYLGNPDAPDFHGKHVSDADLSVIKDASNLNAANLEIQVDLGAGVAPTLSVVAELYPAKRQLGFAPADWDFIKAYARTQFAPSGALDQSQQDISIMASAKAVLYRQFWLHTNLTKMTIKKDEVTVVDRIAPADMAAWQLDNGHPTTAGQFVVDYIEGQNVEAFMPTLKDGSATQRGNYQHLVSTSAADTITVFTQGMAHHADLGSK